MANHTSAINLLQIATSYTTSALIWNTTYVTNRRNYIAKFGKIVVLDFEFASKVSWTGNVWGIIATIPEGYRPTRGSFRFPITGGYDFKLVTGSVDGDSVAVEAMYNDAIMGASVVYSIN